MLFFGKGCDSVFLSTVENSMEIDWNGQLDIRSMNLTHMLVEMGHISMLFVTFKLYIICINN